MKILNWTLPGKFERFYKRQAEALGFEPEFVPNPDLPKGVNGRIRHEPEDLPGMSRRIEIRPTLSKKEAKHTITHEMTHLVLEQEGYPTVTITPEQLAWEDCATVLGQMLVHPIMDRRLDEYGFDREAYSGQTLRQIREAFREPPIRVPPGTKSWLVRLFVYVGIMLRLSSSAAEECARLYERRYPSIAREGEQLVSFIREHGFETPLQCLDILHNIFERYGLIPHMQIRDPRTGAPHEITLAWLRHLPESKKHGKGD